MLFIAGNFPMPTTTPPTGVATGTSTKTMEQIAAAATKPLRAVKWGVSFTTAPTAAVICELIETGTVAATVTAHVAAGVMPYERATSTPVSAVQLGTALTGYTATAEGSITSTRLGDLQVVPALGTQLTWEWSLGREFDVPAGRILRVRLTTAASVPALTYVIWDE